MTQPTLNEQLEQFDKLLDDFLEQKTFVDALAVHKRINDIITSILAHPDIQFNQRIQMLEKVNTISEKIQEMIRIYEGRKGLPH